MNEYLREFLRREKIAFKDGEDLAKKSYIKIGVEADTVYPKDKNELISLMSLLADLKIEYRVLGAMSNILICQSAKRYLFVSTELLRGASIENGRLSAMAGMRFSALIRYAMENGYSLLPELFGIPGSVGGMAYTNAGAYGAQMSDALLYAEVYDVKSKRVIRLSSADMDFGYRKSILQTENFVLISAAFELLSADESSVMKKVSEITKRRKESQPTEYRSLGSVFKRPPNDYAARLIDEAGLKGLRIGDAAVSEKHAGFIVNLGSATARDVVSLVEKIRDTVYSRYGVCLSEEIEILR